MIKFLFLILLSYRFCSAQYINIDLYFSVVEKDIEKIFNEKKEIDHSFCWSFRSLKTFPIKKGESCLLPCCQEEKNYYNSIFYRVNGSLCHLVVGIRYYFIGGDRVFYTAYYFDLIKDKSNNFTWNMSDAVSKETDNNDGIP